MQTDIQIGKKRDVYPSKKTLNLYNAQERATKKSTLILDIVLVSVLVLALGKLLVFDILVEKNEVTTKVNNAEAYLDERVVILKDFNKVREEYIRYSYDILVDELKLHNRMDVLAMLEATVFSQSKIETMTISDDTIAITYSGLNLDGTAGLVNSVKAYDIVEDVWVENQSRATDGTNNGDLIITLVSLVEEEEAGGEQ